MTIRTFKAGDDAHQVQVYNTAAGSLPGFKPATLKEVQRRFRTADPSTRFYAEVNGAVVGYVLYHLNGRVSFPWTLPGHEDQAAPLFSEALASMRARQLKTAFTAYRPDWAPTHAFFLDNGFHHARDMVGFIVDPNDTPTLAAKVSNAISPVVPDDAAAIFALMPTASRAATADEFYRHLFRNPFFSSESLFAIRSRQDDKPIAVGILVNDPTFADAKMLDANMPCFRLGAFGTECMQVKRVKGLFSFIAKPDANLFSLGIDLMAHATRLQIKIDELTSLAAQVPSDVPQLLAFYERHFRKQGAFPVFEAKL